MDSNIQVKVVSAVAELRELEGDWFDLWNRCEGLSIFQSPDWLIPWVESFAPHRLWVLEARRHHVLVGLAPFFIYGTSEDRIVAPLGAGVSDYLDLLIDSNQPETLEVLTKFVWERASDWTELRFPDLQATSLLLNHDVRRELARRPNPDIGEPPRFNDQRTDCDFCPQLDLPVSKNDLRTVVPAKQIRNLRAARRALDGARVELADRATLDEFLTALFGLHEKRWQRTGEQGVLADPRVRELHLRAAPRLLERGALRLFGLRHCGQLIACLMAFFERDAARLYMQGYDPDWARYSPGAQLIGAALEQAISEKKRVADFMRGRETYKYYWGARDVPTYRLQIASPGLQTAPVTGKSVV